jgi:predicted HTH domain antitoxin
MERAMSEVDLKVDLPAGLSQDEAKLLLAVKSFEAGKASLGQAARIAGLSKRTFMELLGRYGVPVFDYSPEELRSEVGA